MRSRKEIEEVRTKLRAILDVLKICEEDAIRQKAKETSIETKKINEAMQEAVEISAGKLSFALSALEWVLGEDAFFEDYVNEYNSIIDLLRLLEERKK
jgi:hypothetical protein